MKEADTRACPACAEQILLAAQKCKHCGEWLNANPIEGSDSKNDQLAHNDLAAGAPQGSSPSSLSRNLGQQQVTTPSAAANKPSAPKSSLLKSPKVIGGVLALVAAAAVLIVVLAARGHSPMPDGFEDIEIGMSPAAFSKEYVRQNRFGAKPDFEILNGVEFNGKLLREIDAWKTSIAEKANVTGAAAEWSAPSSTSQAEELAELITNLRALLDAVNNPLLGQDVVIRLPSFPTNKANQDRFSEVTISFGPKYDETGVVGTHLSSTEFKMADSTEAKYKSLVKQAHDKFGDPMADGSRDCDTLRDGYRMCRWELCDKDAVYVLQNEPPELSITVLHSRCER